MSRKSIRPNIEGKSSRLLSLLFSILLVRRRSFSSTVSISRRRRNGKRSEIPGRAGGPGTSLLLLSLFSAVLLLGLSVDRPIRAASETYVGTVERVVDGDTIAFLTSDFERVRVRLYGIDAPERNQAGGAASSAALKAMIEGRTVTVEVLDVDRYSRLVGLIHLDGRLVNLAMVAKGQAWVYDRYCRVKKVCREMTRAQDIARSGRAGLWADPHPIPPWDHRRRGD
jgi:endonuclease YncB( thermonuclease family)